MQLNDRQEELLERIEAMLGRASESDQMQVLASMMGVLIYRKTREFDRRKAMADLNRLISEWADAYGRDISKEAEEQIRGK